MSREDPNISQISSVSRQDVPAASHSISQAKGASDSTANTWCSPSDVPATVKDDSSSWHDGVPEAAEDDFEWDERENAWTTHDLLDEGSIRKITDGMATLTANASNTGFLGTVSGAALLREISSPRQDQSRDERRSSVIDYLSSQLHENSPTTNAWLRAQPVMTRAFVDTLIDCYFAFYHPTFPILHEATFRQQFQSLHERPKGNMHTLANLVAALGSFVSTDAHDETDVNLFNNVKSQLTIDSLESGSLSLVQAFAMAANYLQKRNRPNSGYNYGGVALRLAISLGLHKEFRSWTTAPLKKEIRRRVWWSLCILDVGATITYGRPLNWPKAGVEAHLPLNIDEQDMLMTSPAVPAQLDRATTYSYVRTQSSYHLTTIPIYERLLTGALPSAVEMIRMDDELIGDWRSKLPTYFADTNLSLQQSFLLGHTIGRWRLRIMRIIMYRPFFLRWVQEGLQPLYLSNPESSATNRCLLAAEECIQITSYFWSTAIRTRLAAWYALYFLLQAVLIPVHCLHRTSAHPQTTAWITQVRVALEIMDVLANINPNALKCKDIIYKLCSSHVIHHDSQVHQPTRKRMENSHQDVSDPQNWSETWMTELDTAINNYDLTCNQLANSTGSGTYENSYDYAGLEAFNLSSFGISAGTYDLDPSMIHMQ